MPRRPRRQRRSLTDAGGGNTRSAAPIAASNASSHGQCETRSGSVLVIGSTSGLEAGCGNVPGAKAGAWSLVGVGGGKFSALAEPGAVVWVS